MSMLKESRESATKGGAVDLESDVTTGGVICTGLSSLSGGNPCSRPQREAA